MSEASTQRLRAGAHDPVRLVLDRLDTHGLRSTGAGKWEAKCPSHEDNRASLSIAVGNDGRALLHCHAGCDVKAICAALHIEQKDLFADVAVKAEKPRIAKTYDYLDENGALLYQAVRYVPKDFKQRRPDGRGGWIWNLQGVPRVLYRLPGLLAAIAAGPTAAVIYIVEGEKDADCLCDHGLVATCNVMGAGKWRNEYSEHFRGCRVGVIADKDKAGTGQKHARTVCKSLHGIAAEVKYIELPGNLVKDAYDWFATGGTAEQLTELVAGTPVFDPIEHDEPTSNAQHDVVVGNAPIHEVARLQNDIGNAARFVTQHRHHLMYVRGNAFVNNGQRWSRDETSRVIAMAKDSALAIAAEAAGGGDSDARATALRWAAKSQSLSRINAMIELSRPELTISPDQLDSDPMLLNVANGTLNLRTGALQPHNPEDFITRICAARYSRDSEAPLFLQFLQRTFRSNPDAAAYVLRAMGYALTGTTQEQAIFFLYGAGANGKSTLVDVIMHVMGSYAGKASREILDDRDQHPTSVADLEGLRLASITETSEGRKLDEGRLKELSGERFVKARRMREDFYTFPMQAKLFIQGNHKPLIRGTDHGFWRRMKLIPFLETIPDSERIPDLAEKLKAEADGILTLLVTGCHEWLTNGLREPQAVREATAEYRSEQDLVGQFLEEVCTSGGGHSESAGDLYRAYQHWAESAGEYVVSQRRFGGQLRERGFERQRSSVTGRYEWRGIRLNDLNH